MSIRFKFRSSVNFDTVDIDGRASISVRDLRSKILSGKNLGASRQQQQDFDLVFLDAVSGQEYKDDHFQIPSESSVIVKRVPAGTPPSNMVHVETVKDFRTKAFCQVMPSSKPVDEFDDFGTDLCPAPDANFPDFDLEFDKNKFRSSEKEDIAGLRFGCQKLETSGVSQALPRGSHQSENERNILQKPRIEEQMNVTKPPSANLGALQNTNLPLELKCSLCNTFFKEAVMIPCCQHSFCEQCIRQVLIEKGRCPKCFSSKCKVEDLLPNVSLRRAIEHCLESQMLDAGLENAMEKYAPDGESGIQIKDGPCALTVVQMGVELPQSSSATGKGSNHIFMESYYESQHRRNAPYRGPDNHVSIVGGDGDLRSAPPSQKAKQIDALRGGNRHNVNVHGGFGDFSTEIDFQGENQPIDIRQPHVHDEADSTIKRKGGFWIETGGGDRNLLAHGGYKKGGRNCYTCGSPYHLMRDCPLASNLHPFQSGNGAFHGGMPGYAPPYWNGSMLPFRPYASMYGNPAMMPFNASMVPVTPFAVPPYVPSMSVGFPGPGGNMGMGSMGPPVGNRAERPHYSEHLELQHVEQRRKYSNENLGREKLCEEDSHEYHRDDKPEKSQQYKSQKEKEHSLSQSEDSFTRRLQRKSQHEKYMDSDIHRVGERLEKNSRSSLSDRDKRLYHSERSNSGIEDMSKSSDRHSEGRHKDYHGESKHHKRREECDSDASLGRPPLQKDVRRDASDTRGSQKKHHNSVPVFQQSSSADRRRECKARDSGHDSRHSRHSTKHIRNEQCDDKWQMISGSSYDYKDEYHHHKRKRVY